MKYVELTYPKEYPQHCGSCQVRKTTIANMLNNLEDLPEQTLVESKTSCLPINLHSNMTVELIIHEPLSREGSGGIKFYAKDGLVTHRFLKKPPKRTLKVRVECPGLPF